MEFFRHACWLGLSIALINTLQVNAMHYKEDPRLSQQEQDLTINKKQEVVLNLSNRRLTDDELTQSLSMLDYKLKQTINVIVLYHNQLTIIPLLQENEYPNLTTICIGDNPLDTLKCELFGRFLALKERTKAITLILSSDQKKIANAYARHTNTPSEQKNITRDFGLVSVLVPVTIAGLITMIFIKSGCCNCSCQKSLPYDTD